MIRALAELGRNLIAGVRLALLLPVSRADFRIGLRQLVLLFVLSALLDVGSDRIRLGADAEFSWHGAGGEFVGGGMLLFCAALIALTFRRHALALAIPLLALAAYPVIQIVHALPALLPSLVTPNWSEGAFELVLTVWTVIVFVRVVAVAPGSAQPLRWAGALAGGLLLAAPIVLVPALTPSGPWWRSTTTAADDRYPNAAAEPVLAAQQSLLDDALANLEDERPGEVDLYFVAFAGDARDSRWRTDVANAQHVMDERWDTRDRSIVLQNSPETLLDTPMATVTNLRETLKELAAAIDKDDDVVMLYLAGPSSRDGALSVVMPPLDLAPITPGVLRSLLDESGIRWSIVVVASCRAGEFASKLADDTTLVLTATGEGATFGCERNGDATELGAALFGDTLQKSESLRTALEAAHARIVDGEKKREGGTAHGARLVIGPAMAEKLKEIDRARATRRSSRSV
jgi:hypothetical protein